MARHKVEISGVNTANIKVLTSEEIYELAGMKMPNSEEEKAPVQEETKTEETKDE